MGYLFIFSLATTYVSEAACVLDNAACTLNSECCSKYCDATLGKCNSNCYLQYTAPPPPYPNQCFCTSDTECASANCGATSNLCTSPTNTIGSYCTYNSDCAATLVCGSNLCQSSCYSLTGTAASYANGC